jgi:uncharacterized cupin superfamily protein
MLRRVNLYDVELEHDEEPQGYGAGYRRVGPLVEADEMNLNLMLLEAGQAVCPYHYEYAEEWLLVIEGEVVVRTPDGEERRCAATRSVSPPDRTVRTRFGTTARRRRGW